MKRTYLIIISFLSVTTIAMVVGIVVRSQQDPNIYADAIAATKSTVSTLKEPIYRYGINMSEFVVIDQKVEPNELIADILLKHNVAFQTAQLVINGSRNVFNCRKMKAGDKYTVLGENTDTGFVAKKIVYEENKLNYVVFNLDDSLYIYRGQNKVKRKRQEVAGVINGSLYETFDEMGVPSGLAMRLADVFSCTIDFYRIQKGDKFKIIYDQDFVDDKPIGVGEISAAVFNSSGKDYYAFYYEKEKSHEGEYFDEQGNSMRKQFLKAPLKFFQITSKYSLNRFHPVAMEWRAHLGTDYAAAYGTPILATADGVIEEAQFGVYNGNYVKIRHNGQYKTQYLHMSKIGQGMHPGRHVKQGEVIGYVGSTGLATGPHVCYRFWKDGAQVDPFKQKLQFSEPLAKKYKAEFLAQSAPFKTSIDQIAYGTKPVLPADEKLQALHAYYESTAYMAKLK
ncbi:MAG: metalloendopeptidase-like rane protein [Bacteroidetes bacterium]|nr:metalloendopeptidase-like rane protein [Bacteroidota bacterium]